MTSLAPSPALQVLIADDEALARRRLQRLLQAIPGVQACGECVDGDEVIARVREGGVDVVLLDIHMPGLDGWDALALMPEERPYIIFCTAHADHAVKAFDAGAVDYLLKPIEAARLQKALDRARAREDLKRFQLEQQRTKEPAPVNLSRLPISTHQGIVLLDPEDISHAVLDGELVRVTAKQGEFLTDATLQDLHDRLPKEHFMRVHRRALVNLRLITRLEPVESGGFLARTQKGDAIEVSRQAARELRRWLGLRRGPE